jgi:hypothetical protein
MVGQRYRVCNNLAFARNRAYRYKAFCVQTRKKAGRERSKQIAWLCHKFGLHLCNAVGYTNDY